MPKPNQKGRPPVNIASLGRLMKMLFQFYPVMMPVTIFCIIFSSIAAAIPDMYIQKVIAIITDATFNDTPWAAAKEQIMPNIIFLIVLYIIAIGAVTLYSQLMAFITQGFLNKMRQSMFKGMQDLPIRYFDTHKHGDIMSYYTNDIDTLRQLVSQALPTLLRAGVVVIAVFFIMLYYSVWMTLITVIGVILMFIVSGKMGGGSAKYFLRQQQSIAKAEGYIQEIMNGQKVVKVFNREQKCIDQFDEINKALQDDSYKAHAYANTLGPVVMNIGNVLYVLVAVAGGLMVLWNGF
ncbi:MAG: ABC transporter ATP-binding protein, partial [Oscillospiraceae bacterium]|nr:ABC transporter ATP-binding protein [Oscillospiraceae bacterium]